MTNLNAPFTYHHVIHKNAIKRKDNRSTDLIQMQNHVKIFKFIAENMLNLECRHTDKNSK